MSLQVWIIWAAVLFAQNYSFTFVSRARNSASLQRHIVAALFSNLIWFVAQLILVTDLVDSLKGANGPWIAVLAAIMYTVCTVGGSVLAHYQALNSERGLNAVGANVSIKAVSHDEWRMLMQKIEDHNAKIGWLSQIKKVPAPEPIIPPMLFTFSETRTETIPQKESTSAATVRTSTTPRSRAKSKGPRK